MIKVIVSIHGVRSGRKNWQDKLGEYINKTDKSIYYHAYKYGWIPSFYSVIPFIRRYHIKKFQKWLECKIYPLYGEDICIVGHSFGTYISFHSLKDIIRCKKLILFGSILHCREDFKGIVPDRIKELHNFHSKTDEVCMLNPIGHSGAWGFRNKKTKSKIWRKYPYPKNKKIINHKSIITEHTQWFPKSFSEILELL